MIDADHEIDYIEAYDALGWLEFSLSGHSRSASLQLKSKEFVYAGLKFKCCNGP